MPDTRPRRRLTLPIKLFPWQQRVEDDPHRFQMIKAGRRSGKTKYAAYRIVKWALSTTGERNELKPDLFWYVARTYDLIREEFWPTLLQMIPHQLIVKKNDNRFSVTISNGRRFSTITCKSAEREDDMRGRGVRGMVIDEASFLKQSLFNLVLRPTLADHRGPALIISSPKPGWFTRQYEFAASGKDKEWSGYHFTIYDNPNIDREEIETIRRSTPEDVWRQEYMAEEVGGSGVVYTEWVDEAVIDAAEMFPTCTTWPGVIGCDWGMDDPTAAVWIHFTPAGIPGTPAGIPVIEQEHSHQNWDIPRHAAAIKDINRGRIIESSDMTLDVTAWKRESTGTSVADQFRKEGLYFQKSEWHGTDAGISLIKRFLRGNGKRPWLYVDRKCKGVIEGMRSWEQGQHEPDALSATRYGLLHAIRRKMTAILDSVKEFDFDAFGAAHRERAALRRLPTISRNSRTQWGWDSEYGVPA